MPFCSNCGAEAQGRFCAKCGSPVAPPTGGGGGYAPPAPPPAAPQVSAPGLADNMAGALCYLLLAATGILFLVIEPYNRNQTIRFHAFQSIFVTVAVMAISIGASIIGLIPIVGLLVYFAIFPVLAIGVFILWLVLMYKAYNNERWVVPIVGPLAEKQV